MTVTLPLQERSAPGSDNLAGVVRLHRRLGFGLFGDALTAAAKRPAADVLAELTNSSTAPPASDPWKQIDLTAFAKPRKAAPVIVGAWLDSMVASSAPAVDRLVWLLHGWLVSSLEKVRSAELMINQLRLFGKAPTLAYPDLLREVSRDGAMLWYLDGKDSTGDHPNENFSRELMELFALGVGNYTEADVQAGAKALTGWTLRRKTGVVRFVPRLHDSRAQQFLGHSVRDIDTVVAAIVAQPSHATFVARRIAREILGSATDEQVARIAEAYAQRHLLFDALRAAGQLLLDGGGAPMLTPPIPWLVMARRATGATPKLKLRPMLGAAGQVPMAPPNVAGWPSGRAWLSTSTTVARSQMAIAVAQATDRSQPAARAASGGSLDDLAAALGIPGGWSPATAASLKQAKSPVSRLALALLSPEFVIS